MQNKIGMYRRAGKAAAVLALLGATVGGLQAQTKTAQSIMIDASSIASTYAIAGTETYRFDIDAAATYFTNAWNGVAPTVSWSNKGSSAEAATLTAPQAPAPLASIVIGNGQNGNIGKDGLVGENKCTFLNGGTLVGTSYTQSVDVVLGSNGDKRTYTYVFTYNVTPNQVVLPFTAWVLQDSSTGGTTVSVDVVAMIAGESLNVTGNSKLGTKYSFSLLQNDGITVRIQNVGVAVDGGVPNYTGTLTYFDRGNTPGLDFYYVGNAGVNGTAQSSLKNYMYASAILNTDGFAGNDNGGADGKALAEVMLSNIAVDLAAGPHTITITAVVKDNSGALVGNVTVSKSVDVITPGCGGNAP